MHALFDYYVYRRTWFDANQWIDFLMNELRKNGTNLVASQTPLCSLQHRRIIGEVSK